MLKDYAERGRTVRGSCPIGVQDGSVAKAGRGDYLLVRRAREPCRLALAQAITVSNNMRSDRGRQHVGPAAVVERFVDEAACFAAPTLSEPSSESPAGSTVTCSGRSHHSSAPAAQLIRSRRRGGP